jgi:hypothetical protein
MAMHSATLARMVGTWSAMVRCKSRMLDIEAGSLFPSCTPTP